ncbi:MAG: RIP metalloprotease RseP [Ruminococcaceae bacterium]|nr:RIP metalloprotease RseP [Oscillospiraceae bacterium]
MSVVLTILASIFIFGLIIFIHELGHFIAAKKSKITVNEFSLGMGPRLFGFTKGETKYNLRLLPIGGFVAMEGEDEESDKPGAFNKAPVWNRIWVVASGAIMNLILGFIVVLALTCSMELLGTRTIGGFAENAATEASGLQVDDTIVAINGRKTYLITDIQYEIARIRDGSADITVKRGGEEITLDDVKFDTAVAEDGTETIVFDMIFYGVKPTFGTVMTYSFRWTLSIAKLVVSSLVDLVTGSADVSQLSGPVGIVTVVGQAAQDSFFSVLMLLAFISINLGIFNILPLPALDGGRLIFLLFEAITKKKLDSKYESLVNVIGFVLLMLLMVFVTYNDITRLVK